MNETSRPFEDARVEGHLVRRGQPSIVSFAALAILPPGRALAPRSRAASADRDGPTRACRRGTAEARANADHRDRMSASGVSAGLVPSCRGPQHLRVASARAAGTVPWRSRSSAASASTRHEAEAEQAEAEREDGGETAAGRVAAGALEDAVVRCSARRGAGVPAAARVVRVLRRPLDEPRGRRRGAGRGRRARAGVRDE